MRTALWLPLAVCIVLVVLVDSRTDMGAKRTRSSGCPPGHRKTYTSKKWCKCVPPQPEFYGSLIFVIDTTGSMQPELNAVKENIGRILTANTRFKDYVVALFGDPYIRKVRRSASKKAIRNFIRPIRASKGGDCPEYSLSGVEDALKLARGKSVLFLFTDAAAKDRVQKEKRVISMLKKRRVEVIVIATGQLCYGKYKKEYHHLVDVRGGRVIHMVKEEIDDVMAYVIRGVKGELSFKGFPKDADKLRASLEGTCSCRMVKIKKCIPLPKPPQPPKPSCPRGFEKKERKEKTCSCKPIRPDNNYGSLIFVVDITNSMQTEIDIVKDNIQRIVKANRRFDNYVIATFGDPYVRQVLKSNNKEKLWDRLDSIFARGGGDCPEYSLSAVVDAARAADKNSVLFLFTDASAKDYDTKLDEAKKILVERRIQIITVATGDLCKRKKYSYHREYDILAKATGGKVAKLSKGSMKKVMKFVLKAVAGEISFQAFPSSASELDSALKGSCECRVEILISCVKIAVEVKCPKDYTTKGRCVDGKRTDTRFTFRVVKGVCVKSAKKTVRYKGCEHTKCKKSTFSWSSCVGGWKSRTEYVYTYKEGLHKCVRTARKVGRARCKMPCPVYKRVLSKGNCHRYKGKFYRTVKFETNVRHKVYLCKREKKSKRVRCILTPCPKSRVVRGVCKVGKERGHKKGRKSITFSHDSAVYTHDKHIYYSRNANAKCIRRERVQRRLCAAKMCRCFAIGDPHYKTFDRLRIDFYGGCKYVLSETVSTSGECAFRIAGRNWYRGHKLKHRVTWTKYLEITIGGHTYKLGQQRLLFVDGNPTLVPHRLKNGLGYIFFSGRAIEFASEKCGINVYWDGQSSAGLQINRAKYGSRVRGLCGNCDGDASNDLTDSSGVVYKERSYTNVQKFALSYLVTEKSESEEEIEQCKRSDGPPEISIEIEKKYSEKEWCGLISKTSGPFSKCLSSGKISYEFYFRSCVIDLSLLEEQQTLLKQTFCEIIKTVNEDCAEIGFEGIDWRGHADCTPKCPANSHFTTKMNPCPATCESSVFRTKRQCFKLPNREGCECKNGYVLDGQRCVRMGECSCLSCNDAASSKQCARWKRQGHCKSLFETSGMLMACRKTCGFCHEKPTCEDYIASSVCAKAKATGKCENSFYKHFCGLTCNWRNCPCRSAKTIRGKCEDDGTRKVTIFRYKRGEDRECTLDRVERRESCRECVGSIKRVWGKCNYCTGKRVGKKTETYRSGIRCLKRRTAIYMSCSLCKFPNGKKRQVIDRFCKGGNNIITRYKVKRQTGCYKCSTEKTFKSKVVACRKRPRVSTTPVRGTKTEKLKICLFKLRKCRCLESCNTVVQPTECKPRALIKKRCVIRDRVPVWKSIWQYERLVRKKLNTKCQRFKRRHTSKVVCPKRLKSITIRGKNCKLSARITFYHVNSKCQCKKEVKYKSKGYYCCPKPKTKKGPCSILRGVNVMRTVRTTFYKLVKGMCIKQTSGKRRQVCNCRPTRFKRECQFGKLSQRVMKCRVTKGARGNYCKCSQEKTIIPVTCRSTSSRKLTGCTIRKGINRYMRVRYFYFSKERCKCVKRHRDRLVWCGCHGKPMYEVKPCPKKCKDPKRCSNRCVKKHIRYVGVMRMRNKRKVCVRKIVSLQKERCCCSPVILNLKPRQKCVSGGLLFKYTYVKKLCRGKKSKMAQCCVVRRSTSRRVPCKQGVIKTEASRCGGNGYFTVSKTIAKLKKCKCVRKVRRSLCRCKCPPKKKSTICDAGKRIWRVTIITHSIVNCKCKRRVVAREYPLNPCKKMPRSPSKVGKCNKKGIKKLYYFYSVRSGCKCKKRTKVRTCHCSCSGRVSYTRWRCNAKSGVRTRTKTYMVKQGCHCMAKRKVERKQTRCNRRRKVEKICRNGVLAFFLREYKRRGCKCHWKITNVVRRRCDPPKPPKEIVKKQCKHGKIRVIIRTKIRWIKKTIRLFDRYYKYIEKVVTKHRSSHTVTCKKRSFSPEVRPCRHGKYLKITRYTYVKKCQCKVGSRRKFKNCICRKSMKRESSKCDKKRFAIVSTWQYRKWNSGQESCIWVRKTVRNPVHCSFKNKVVRGRCRNGKTYKITTHVQMPDRNKCKCLKLKESRTANCFCKPIVRRKKCDKGRSCVRYTFTTSMKWNYKKSRCIPFGKTIKKRIVCCCSKKVNRKTYCAPDGHRRVTRTWKVYASKPIPRCIQKKQTDKLVINCQAAKYQKRLLRKTSSRSSCGRNNFMVIRYYRLRLNKKKCRCEKYVHRKKRCRCRCRRGEKFERSFCKKGTNRKVRVYSRMLLKNCGCVKKLIHRASGIRCRRKPITTRWSGCNKKTCQQYRIDVVERPRNCKCKSITRRRLNIKRRCCCNKKTTSDTVCTKMGLRITTVYYNFDRRTRRCARKTRQKVVQDDDLINCKRNPRHTRVKAANCALVIYHNRYWIDFRKCECRKKSKPVKAGKWCCSKKSRVKRHCKNRVFVFVTTVQKLKGMKCVNKYSYRKKSVPCRRGRNTRGKCNKTTGWATDYISEARVMLNCYCKKTRVPKKRRCACPKTQYVTDCLKNAGIVRKIKVYFLLRNGRCIRKRKVVSETKVCTKKPVLDHSSSCKGSNYITDTYKAQRRVGCKCFTKYFNKQRLCRCKPLRSKKAICKGRYLRVLHYMHFVNKKYTACNKKIVSKEKIPIMCRSSTRVGKCEPSGMKGRMVQKVEKIIRHIRKCKCTVKRVIESTRICKCPDDYKKKSSCNRESERRKIVHFSFTLNSSRTKCRRHQRISHEVCFCNKRARNTTKCDRRSGNNLVISTWRQFNARTKSCIRKRTTDIQEVICEEKTTRTKTDCTASGWRTDIIKKHYKDFNSCSCRHSPRPVKVRCACVPECHKKIVRCVGGELDIRQKCYRLKAVSPYANKCVPYYQKRTKSIKCCRKVKYQKFSACKKCWKTFHKWVYKNINCKCKRVKKFWKKARCCCPKKHCRTTCERKGTAKITRCTWFRLSNGSCVRHIDVKVKPVKCLKRQEYWTKCRKQKANGRWFRCSVLKSVIRSAVRNCKCKAISTKVHQRYCCCGPRTVRDRCNVKTGVTTRTITKKVLIGEGFCKPVPKKKVIPAPTCRGTFKGENSGKCDLKRNIQKFFVWTVYRHGCKCKRRKSVRTSACGCRRKKPLGPFWTKCVKGIRKVYFYYFERQKAGQWRYKCVKKRVNHNVADRCGPCGKPDKTSRVCKGDYWLRITRGWRRQTRRIKIPGRYHGSIKVSYRVCVRNKKTKASKSISCPEPPERKATCNNFRKRIYRYYNAVRQCTCRLKRSLITIRACNCHKKNYSKLRCNAQTNQLVTSDYIYTAKNRVCVKKRRDVYRKAPCRVGKVVRDKTVRGCKNGRRKGLSIYKRVRYYVFYYSNCKCKKRFFTKWKLCGCASKRKREICRNGKWYSTLYSVTPRFDRNTCQVTKRFVNRDVSCSRNAHKKLLSPCNASCIRKYAVYYRRLDRRTCRCRIARPIILKQVCGCNKCPKVGRNKITKQVTCAVSDGIKIFTTIKKVFVHNGNLFNKWDITVPKYMCIREVKNKKNKIVCSKGSTVTKEKCVGAVRKLTVKRQVRVACRCRVKYSTVPGGRCKCKGKKPKPPKVWKSDNCSKPPFMRRVTIYSYKLDKTDPRNWKCKVTSKTIKQRCGCPRKVKNSAYCNGKGSIIHKKSWKQFLPKLRSCVWKNVISKKAASCSKAQLEQNNIPPRKTACKTASNYMVTYVKKWYEVDPRDCKCKLRTKHWDCPCRCTHKNKVVNKRCLNGHTITYTAVTYTKRGCKCLKTTRGRKKIVSCRHKREDTPDRIVVGKCQRKGPSRNAGYVRVVYEKEYPRRCKCKTDRRKRWEPCDCSLIPQYKSTSRLVCHRSGAFFNRVTTYFVVQLSKSEGSFCEKRRRTVIVRINKCFDRRGRPLRRRVNSGFDKCSRKRTGCRYKVLIQQSRVRKCACKWRTIEVIHKKCCCDRPTVQKSCLHHDTKVRTKRFYILDGSGQCVKKTKKQKYTLTKKKACKYSNGFVVRCRGGKKQAVYRKYYPAKFHFSDCKCIRYYKDIRVPCRCIPKKIVKKVRCDAKRNRWVHEVVVRTLRGKNDRTRCVSKSKFSYTKTCTRMPPRISMGRCNKSKVRLRTTLYEVKRNCRCVRKKKLDTIPCTCQKKTWWVSLESQCKRHRNGYSYYPKVLKGYRYVEKTNRCVVAELRKTHVICGCPKPRKTKRCVRNKWKITEVKYVINKAENTCVKKTRRKRKPMTECSTKKVREEESSFVDTNTGYKTIVYKVVVNRGCKCVRYKETVKIEWLCEVIMKSKIVESQSCFKGVILQKRAGEPYFNKQDSCTVDYSIIKIDVTGYCPKSGKVRRKVIGKCSSKTGRHKVQYSSWKPNLKKCTCERTVKIEHEICDCEPIHNRYKKRGCRNNNTKYEDTFFWTLVNGVCVRGRQRVEKEVSCKVGRFKKESQCDPLSRKKEITVIERKIKSCSCRETVKKYKCMCKCKKDVMTKMCDSKTGYTIITKIRYELKQCACKKRTTTVRLKPPPPCGKKTKKKGNCRRSPSSDNAVAGYQKVTVCEAKRQGCKCRLECRSRKRLCYCSPEVKVKKRCLGHTKVRVSTLKFTANNRRNRCEWKEVSKVTIDKDCYAMVDIPDTKQCNKKNGVLIIKHWRYQPINCKCKKRVYKITRGRCKCNGVWRKVSEGQCDTTDSCTKPVVYERKVLHGIRCIKKRKTDYVTCSCDCKPSVAATRKCERSTGTWVTSQVTWKLRCSRSTKSCKCERRISKKRQKPKCNGKQELPYCNKRTRRVEVRIREERLSRSKCRCYWTVVKTKHGFCHCRQPEVKRRCEAHKYRIKLTTITETLDEKHWRCIRSRKSTHVPVKPSCKPRKSVKNIGCNALKDKKEWKVVTIRMLHPKSCKCIRIVHRYPQVCICDDLPERQRYLVKCQHKTGRIIRIRRSRVLQRSKNGKKSCNIVIKTSVKPISCGDGTWRYVGSPKCRMLAKNGCNSYRKYKRIVRKGCTCKPEFKRKPCKCCCPKGRKTRICSADGKRHLFTKYIYEKRGCKCVRSTRRWSVPVECSQHVGRRKKCLRDGRERIVTTVIRPVNCACKKFSKTSWCRCRCPKPVRESRCDSEKRQKVSTLVQFRLKGCKCQFKQDVNRRTVHCKTRGRKKYRKVGKCNMTTRMQLYEYHQLKFDEVNCVCKKRKMRIYKPCKCKGSSRKVIQQCNKACRKIIQITRYRISGTKCRRKTYKYPQVCCCLGKRYSIQKCDPKKGMQIQIERWQKMEYDENDEPECNWKEKERRTPISGCNTSKVTSKDTKCVGRKYTRSYFRNVIRARKHKKGSVCRCVNSRVRKQIRYCKCPRSRISKTKCRNDNVLVSTKTMYILEDGSCSSYTSRTEKVLRCDKSLKRKFKWSKCDRRTCKQKKYGTLCSFRNCKIDVRVDYRNPKVYDCCCPSSKVQIKFLECQDKKKRRVYRKFWQVFHPKRMVCKNFAKNIYKPVRCGGWKARKVFPGACRNKGADKHYYQRLRIRYNEYEEGCTCREKTLNPLRLCKCRGNHNVKVCRRDGVLEHRTMSYRLVGKKGKRSCKPFIAKHWEYKPPCVPAKQAKWRKSVSKCVDGIKVITDYRRVRIGCKCKKQEKVTTVICGCSKTVTDRKRCRRGRWEITKYGKKLSCRSERFCSCVPYKYTTHKLPDCPKGSVKKSPCVRGFQKVEARLYAINNCQCKMREFSRHRRCPDKCPNLISTRTCVKLMKEGLCEHPQRKGTVGQICARTCGKCFKCESPHTIKYRMFSGFSLKSSSLYSKRFYIKTIRKTKVSHCMMACKKDEGCNSFDYNSRTKTCILNSVSKFTFRDRISTYKEADHKVDVNIVHFVKYCKHKCRCGAFTPLGKCVCEGSGVLRRCYKQFTLREFYNMPDGRCAQKAKTIRLKADCENPCVDQIENSVCRREKQAGKCLKDRETRILCNKTCSRCACNKQYTVKVPCKRVKGSGGRRSFERKFMQVRYKRAKCGICSTSYKVRREKCKPPACFEQTIKVIGDCIAGKRLVITYAIELTDMAQCKRKKVEEVKYSCKGVCNTVSKQVSKCRYHKKDKKFYRNVMSSFWVSDASKPKELAFTRKYLCDPSVCPKEMTFKGPCLLGHRFRYRVYYVLDYRERCTKFVDAHGEACSSKKSKRCFNVLPRKKCAEVKKKGYCLRHNGPSRLCMKTCGLCKPHRVRVDKKKKNTNKKTISKKTTLDKTKLKEAHDIINGISSRYGGRYLQKVTWATMALSDSEEGKAFIEKSFKINKHKINPPSNSKSMEDRIQIAVHEIEEGKSGGSSGKSKTSKTKKTTKKTHKKVTTDKKKKKKTKKSKSSSNGGSEKTTTTTTTTTENGSGSGGHTVVQKGGKNQSEGGSSETQTQFVTEPETKTETEVIPGEEQIITTTTEHDGSGKMKITRHVATTKNGKTTHSSTSKIIDANSKDAKLASEGGSSSSFSSSSSSSSDGGDGSSSFISSSSGSDSSSHGGSSSSSSSDSSSHGGSSSSDSSSGSSDSSSGSSDSSSGRSGGSSSSSSIISSSSSSDSSSGSSGASSSSGSDSSSGSSGGNSSGDSSSSQVLTSGPEETVTTTMMEGDGGGKMKVTRHVSTTKGGKTHTSSSTKFVKGGGDSSSFMSEDQDALDMSGFM